MILPITRRPEMSESFMSYLMRLTELNGYDSPSWILSLGEINSSEFWWKFTLVFEYANRLKGLAKITGATETELRQLLYQPAKDPGVDGIPPFEYEFYGASLNRSVIRPHHPKVCPRCILESGYCLRVWDCSLVTACPVHKVMLIDTCPRCGRRIRPVRNRLSYCSCGCDWRGMTPTPVSEAEVFVSAEVYRRCGLQTPPSAALAKRHPLGRLGLRDFVVLTTFIAGLIGEVPWATGAPSKSIMLLNEDLHRLYVKALTVFEDWPVKYHTFIERHSAGAGKSDPHDGKLETALKGEFGALYAGLYKRLLGSQYDFMREAFTDYLTRRLKDRAGQSSRKSRTGSPDISDEYYSVTAARKRLRISHHSLFSLVRSGEIDFVVRDRQGAPQYCLRASDVESLATDFDRAVSARVVAKGLGISCEAVRELGDSGYIKLRWRPAVDGQQTRKYDHRSAELLLAKVRAEAVTESELYEADMLDFAQAKRLFESSGIGVAALVKAMADGNLRHCSITDQTGLQQYVFEKNRLLELAQSLTARSSAVG